jgi:DNA-binding HxlR family transcriptional regulator
MPMPDNRTFRSDCPIASTLDIFGDRWSLVIIRDMTFGSRRFSDFVKGAEGIKRNILTDRLRRLEAEGIIRKKPYQTKPVRHEYTLTNKGADLLPIIQSLAIWGQKHLSHTYDPPDILLNWKPGDFYQ